MNNKRWVINRSARLTQKIQLREYKIETLYFSQLLINLILLRHQTLLHI